MRSFPTRTCSLPHLAWRLWGLLALIAAASCSVNAQQPDPASPDRDKTAQSTPSSAQTRIPPAVDPAESDTKPEYGFKRLAEDFWGDQKEIWTSPARLRFEDADWLKREEQERQETFFAEDSEEQTGLEL